MRCYKKYLVSTFLLLLKLVIVSQASLATFFCRHEGDSYGCSLAANITNENDVLVIEDYHEPGFGDKDVEYLSTTSNTTIIELPGAILDKFF